MKKAQMKSELMAAYNLHLKKGPYRISNTAENMLNLLFAKGLINVEAVKAFVGGK